jgi:Xaa-Pro aminopeptidase
MATKTNLRVCADRVAVVREQIRRNSIDALVITNTHHLRYLFGFSGSIATAIISKNKAHFFTNDLYQVQVQQELAPIDGLVIHIARNTWQEAEQQQIANKWTTVGIDESTVSVATFKSLKKALKPAKIIAISNIIEPIIQIKSTHELANLAAAAQIVSEAYTAMLNIVKPGLTERDVANYLSSKTRELGSEKDAFDIIVVAGKRSAMPHGRASNASLKSGDVVTVDFGACVEGMNSDMTRTFVLGKAKRRVVDVFAVLFEAHARAVEASVIGASSSAIDAAARNVINEAGFGKNFQHSTGHGLGYEVHEHPRVSAISKEKMPGGVVITIEPGIYLPGEFGMRIEDDVLITEDGPQVLTTAPGELVIV